MPAWTGHRQRRRNTAPRAERRVELGGIDHAGKPIGVQRERQAVRRGDLGAVGVLKMPMRAARPVTGRFDACSGNRGGLAWLPTRPRSGGRAGQAGIE